MLARRLRPLAARSFSLARPAPLTDEQLAERRARRAAVREPQAEPLGIEGSVRHYARHFLVVETQFEADAWPKKLERSPAHLVGKYVAAVAAALGGDIRKSPLLVTAGMRYTGVCGGAKELREAKEVKEAPARHDILVFPENLRVFDVETDQIETLALAALREDLNVRELLRSEKLRFEELGDAKHVLVCAHTQRDERCGCKGPELLEWLRSIDDSSALNLWVSSHYGGHRYAANCIVYPSGDWFGLINEKDDAKNLLEAVDAAEPLRLHRQWRGRIGLTEAQQLQAVRAVVGTSPP